jgi:hypothetical protein
MRRARRDVLCPCGWRDARVVAAATRAIKLQQST